MTVMAKATRKWQHLYGSQHWRNLSRHQLRAEPLCRYCKEEGRIEAATIADHIEPHHGDIVKFFTGKLQSLCAPHHNGAKKRLEVRGYDTRIGVDGKPTDKCHPYWTGVLPPSRRRTRGS